MGPMADTDAGQPPSFEEALDRLEEIVKTLEGGDMALEKALEVFEEGVRLSRFCHGKLQQAERRVELLLKDENGDVELRPFQGNPVREPD